jgi:hypothetical protein
MNARKQREDQRRESELESRMFNIKDTHPDRIPTAADHHEDITLIVPEDLPCRFQNVKAIFRRLPDGSVDLTASGVIDDNEDGTMLMHSVFNATPTGSLQIILIKDDCILWTTKDSHLVVGGA